MEFIVWVETRLAGKTLAVEEIAKIDRNAGGIPPEDIGLTLAEGKEVVSQVQRKIVQAQIEMFSLAKSLCVHCSDAQRVKEMRTRQIRTVFGKVKVSCRRYIRCTCRGGRPTVLWPLGMMEIPYPSSDTICSRPAAAAALAIPDLVDFQPPACVIAARSMSKAARSWVAPTRVECPLTPATNLAGIPIHWATRLKIGPMLPGFKAPPTLSLPTSRRNITPSLIFACSSQRFSHLTVS